MRLFQVFITRVEYCIMTYHLVTGFVNFMIYRWEIAVNI